MNAQILMRETVAVSNPETTYGHEDLSLKTSSLELFMSTLKNSDFFMMIQLVVLIRTCFDFELALNFP